MDILEIKRSLFRIKIGILKRSFLWNVIWNSSIRKLFYVKD